MNSGTGKSHEEMIDGNPLVSIGMPVYNCQNTVAIAIRSILAQTYPKWELLVVDDGSSDATVEIAESFRDHRIRVFRDGQHHRISVRLNQGIHLSQGEFFARMDGDDIAYPDRIERQVQYLRDHPDVDVVGASMLVFGSECTAKGKRQVPEWHDDICSDPIKGFAMAHPTLLGRLSWFRQHLYVDAMSLIEDQDLLLRAYDHSRFANIPAILMGYREDNLNFARNLKGRMMLLKRLMTEFLDQGKWATAMRAGIVHSAKGLVYAVCACPGLRKRLLHHRAGVALTPAELDHWQEVSRSLMFAA